MTQRKRTLLILCGLLVGVVGSCGDDADPFCGDGKVDPNEECDEDSEYCCDCIVCLPSSTTVKWTFNNAAVPEFDGDGCVDLGVVDVEVELVGPSPATETGPCSQRQVVFLGLPAGTYTARLRPLDIDGQPLTSAPIEQPFDLLPTSTIIEIDIPPESWTGNYTGSYFFHLLWGGNSCEAAAPPVVEQRLTMEQDGSPVVLRDRDGIDLSGTCIDGIQSALDVPFGFATLRLEGLDQSGVVQFDETFETFVGAGPVNIDYELDVNSVTPDAGVPDAGVPDAGVVDAGVVDAGV